MPATNTNSATPPELVLFLACSFASERMDPNGNHHDHGLSDWELAQRVKQLIEDYSKGRILVCITRDPFVDYVSDAVRKQVVASDLMLCIFTKRVRDTITSRWLPSIYTATEAAAFVSQFSVAENGHRRLFGLVEEGVDRTQLGLAFHGDRTAVTFRRDRLDQLDGEIQRIVDTVIERHDLSKPVRECRSQDKIVTIYRDGRVRVEVRYRFRFNKAESRPSIGHSLWRISRPLPDLFRMLDRPSGGRNGFLRVVPLGSGSSTLPQAELEIQPIRSNGTGNERRFDVKAPRMSFQSGEELHYAVEWEYGDAFHPAKTLHPRFPNSVGMRCGDRGIIERASLTVQFERALEVGEQLFILNEEPKVWRSLFTSLPGDHDPEEFWHLSPSWHFDRTLKASSKLSGAQFEVYHWATDNFSGMVKLTFEPFYNYFQPLPEAGTNQGMPEVPPDSDTQSRSDV